MFSKLAEIDFPGVTKKFKVRNWLDLAGPMRFQDMPVRLLKNP